MPPNPKQRKNREEGAVPRIDGRGEFRRFNHIHGKQIRRAITKAECELARAG